MQRSKRLSRVVETSAVGVGPPQKGGVFVGGHRIDGVVGRLDDQRQVIVLKARRCSPIEIISKMTTDTTSLMKVLAGWVDGS